ncbi:MAG: molybdopterin molybdenumtransferase MoeA, partial [Planctomycetes bacterium]|nr:molybdopterin molybdenumtransferase MoeA [Planctomycetota bacterium]
MAELITLEQARQRVRAAADTLVEFASVSLLDAVGHRLAEDHHAAGPWPATDRAAMDGYAVRAGGGGLAEGTRLRVVGACPAGQTFSGTVAD